MYVREVLQPEVVPFLQGISGTIFQQDTVRPHVAKTVRDFGSAQRMQFLLWPAYLPHMFLIEHTQDFLGWHLVRDLRPAASDDQLWVCIKGIRNLLLQVDIQNLFDSMPHRIAALIAARGGYTKY